MKRFNAFGVMEEDGDGTYCRYRDIKQIAKERDELAEVLRTIVHQMRDCDLYDDDTFEEADLLLARIQK